MRAFARSIEFVNLVGDFGDGDNDAIASERPDLRRFTHDAILLDHQPLPRLVH